MTELASTQLASPQINSYYESNVTNTRGATTASAVPRSSFSTHGSRRTTTEPTTRTKLSNPKILIGAGVIVLALAGVVKVVQSSKPIVDPGET